MWRCWWQADKLKTNDKLREMSETNKWEKANVIIALVAIIATTIISIVTIRQASKQFEESTNFLLEERKEKENSERPIIIVDETYSACDKEGFILADLTLKNVGKRLAKKVSYSAQLFEINSNEEVTEQYFKGQSKINPVLPSERINIYLKSKNKMSKNSDYFAVCKIIYFDVKKTEADSSTWVFKWEPCNEEDRKVECELEDTGREKLNNELILEINKPIEIQ